MKSRNTVFSLVVFFLFFFISGPAKAADALIEEVSYLENDGSSASVIFHLNGPHLPKVFALKGENPRVVFDFLGTRPSRRVPSNILANGTMVQKIRIGVHPDKTRVVIDLVPSGEYHFEQKFDRDENILTIQLVPAGLPQKAVEPLVSATPEKEESPQFPAQKEVVAVEAVAEEAVKAGDRTENEVAELEVQKSSAPQLESPVAEEGAKAEEVGEPAPDPLLSDVSFENTSNNGEMALFKLNGFYPPTVSGQEDGIPRVICDFPGTRLADEVVKDLASHGEYVDRIRVEEFFDPDRVQVTLELVPNKNYDLQQVFFKENNLFVIIVNSYDSLDSSQPTIPQN
ncbi:MAG: AMIN domain-containing protein [Proteobacteria bacterium]|nr:AMIN domain-containing protein [Pseudomonadota bacterium]MBU1419813.1 AMIN domain-containing protein [Pseudomonadota bacterium]MBU1456781.1 AMIN domain-containing protein [Pseudomonadota bacterium]